MVKAEQSTRNIAAPARPSVDDDCDDRAMVLAF